MTAINDHRSDTSGTALVSDGSSTAPAHQNRRGNGNRRGRFSFAPAVLLAPAGLLEGLAGLAQDLPNSVSARRDRSSPRVVVARGGQQSVLRGAAALAVSGVLSPRLVMTHGRVTCCLRKMGPTSTLSAMRAPCLMMGGTCSWWRIRHVRAFATAASGGWLSVTFGAIWTMRRRCSRIFGTRLLSGSASRIQSCTGTPNRASVIIQNRHSQYSRGNLVMAKPRGCACG